MTQQTVMAFLEGKENHLHPLQVLANCNWEIVGQRPGFAPHTIYQILYHIIYWQDLFLERIAGVTANSPEKPSPGWPGADAPADEAAWNQAVEAFNRGFQQAMQLASTRKLDEILPTFRGFTVGESIVFLAQHNNHHFGQIITLCQVLGSWPASEDEWADY